MRILISTYPQDVHCVEGAMVLEERGHEPVLWYGSDFPMMQTASVEFRGSDFSWELRGPDLDGGRPPYDAVWFRRPTPAVLPQDLHPSDVGVAQRECHDFMGSLYFLVAPDAFWVNPLSSRPQADFKGFQLREAVRSGLAIPPTLMSNDPDRIRGFLREYEGRAVYKAFYPAQWEAGDQVAVLLTTELGLDDLPEDDTLRVTPGIFQARIPKSHELRVTVMGSHFVTARLLSQESDLTRVDWRGGGAHLKVEPDRLPEEVEQACLRLMRRLNIVFGAFDFIVTPEGEHVFLEVNPSGQFLWVEEACEDLPMLAPFVEFLESRDPGFRWQPQPGFVRHAAYKDVAVERAKALGPLHVSPGDFFITREGEEAV